MAPQVSVVIPTRNRGNWIVHTIETILRNDFADYEVIVVDQSVDDLTQKGIAPFLNSARFRYLHTETSGSSRARNTGIQHARGELIALTDDDCQVQPNWIAEIARAFERDHRIAVVLGNIFPADHDRAIGFIPNYVRAEPFLARTIREKHRAEGVSACMAIRRQVWSELHGFDEMLGAGERFHAAEETDLIIRALMHGYFVYETPKVFVTHYGLRTWGQAEQLIPNYICGLTAMYVKHFKCCHWSAMIPFLHLVWRWMFQKPVVNFEHFPSRRLRFKGFRKGLWNGMGTPVDRARCLYMDSR